MGQACAPDDVAPRLHFGSVSHLTWMLADERAELATADLGGTRAADPQYLNRLAIDGAVRRIAPLALEAAGQARMAGQLRGLPPIREAADLRRTLEVVRVLGDQLGARTPARRVMIELDRGIRDAMTSGFPDVRCAQIAGHGTMEAAVAAAAIEAGAPRELVTRESVELLDRMAAAARVG